MFGNLIFEFFLSFIERILSHASYTTVYLCIWMTQFFFKMLKVVTDVSNKSKALAQERMYSNVHLRSCYSITYTCCFPCECYMVIVFRPIVCGDDRKPQTDNWLYVTAPILCLDIHFIEILK